MSLAENTRLFDNTVVRVRNPADDAWIAFTRAIKLTNELSKQYRVAGTDLQVRS